MSCSCHQAIEERLARVFGAEPDAEDYLYAFPGLFFAQGNMFHVSADTRALWTILGTRTSRGWRRCFIFDFTTVFPCSFTLVQVAILTLLEGENALLELKAGDDAAKARCSPAVIHSSNSKSHIWNDRWVDYERGLPMFASHAHFMEAAIRYLVNPELSTGYQPKFANFNSYSTTEKRHVFFRRLVAKGVVNADGQVI